MPAQLFNLRARAINYLPCSGGEQTGNSQNNNQRPTAATPTGGTGQVISGDGQVAAGASSAAGGNRSQAAGAPPPSHKSQLAQAAGEPKEAEEEERAGQQQQAQKGADWSAQAATVVTGPPQQWCAPQLSSRGLFWNATRAGQVARQACPEGSVGRASWLCDPERLRFQPHAPDFSQCRSVWLARLAEQLNQLLEMPLAAAKLSSGEMIREQNEQTLRSILGELLLMCKTNELFAEDLKRLDIMLSQMLAQLRSLSVLLGDSAPTWSRAGGQRAAPTPLAPLYEELLAKLVAISSSLFDWAQRSAWLELADAHTRTRLELRLLAHLRDAAQLWASSLELAPPEQGAPLVRQANVLVSVASVQQALESGLLAAGELSLFPPPRPSAVLYGATHEPFLGEALPQQAPLTQLRLPLGLARELSALGEYDPPC